MVGLYSFFLKKSSELKLYASSEEVAHVYFDGRVKKKANFSSLHYFLSKLSSDLFPIFTFDNTNASAHIVSRRIHNSWCKSVFLICTISWSEA